MNVYPLFLSLDDGFDASAIAEKLRSVADALNDDVRFKAALTDMKNVAATQVNIHGKSVYNVHMSAEILKKKRISK